MSDDRAVAIVLGTRPEIIKMAPVLRASARASRDAYVLHTGQHYSHELDGVFFSRLDLPPPRYNLHVGSASQGAQTGRMLEGIEKILLEQPPAAILVQGDTNSVLAGALAAAKLGIPVGHVEAGLRSGDRRMPEETNRIVTDHISDHLFAPTEGSAANLRREGLPGARIHVTGNTVVDAVLQNRQLAESSSDVLRRLGLEPKGYLVVTAHRAENVDDAKRFQGILDGASQASAALGVQAVYPIHPRSRARLAQFGLDAGKVRLVDPLDYFDFLRLQSAAALVLTDSGGVQEESCILGVPCLTLRDNTERPETMEVGANLLVGTEPRRIVEGARRMLESKASWSNPFGDGRASERILSVLEA